MVTGTNNTIPITDPIMLWTRLTFTAKGKTEMKKSGYHTQQVIRQIHYWKLMHIRTCADIASQSSLSVSTFNTTVKNHEGTEISYIRCSHFSKQLKLIKHLLLKELEPAVAAQFKQESISNILVHCTITQQSSYTLQLVWVLTTSWVSTNGKADLREDIPLFTKPLACDSKSGNLETVDDWKNGCML
jgi:hypothetical protein